MDRKTRIGVLAAAAVLLPLAWYQGVVRNDPDRTAESAGVYQVGSEQDLDRAVGPAVPDAGRGVGAADATPSVAASAGGGERLAPEDYASRSRFGPLPPSLEGTVPLRLSVDADGQLVVSPAVFQLFEYFLAGVYDEGLETALARIQEYLELSLPPEAAAEALALLQPYLDYKQRLEGMAPPTVSEANRDQIMQDLKAALDERAALRQALFSPELADALFGVEAAYDAYAWQAAQVVSDAQLDAETRSARLHALEEALPSALRERVREARIERETRDRIEALRRQGAPPEALHEVRSQVYGEAVADRWTFLEDRSPSWNARVARFQEEAARLRDDGTLSLEERRRQILQLRQSQFSSEEQIKLALHELQASSEAASVGAKVE